MVNEMKFNTDLIIEKDKLLILDEYAKCTKIYSAEIESLKH